MQTLPPRGSGEKRPRFGLPPCSPQPLPWPCVYPSFGRTPSSRCLGGSINSQRFPPSAEGSSCPLAGLQSGKELGRNEGLLLLDKGTVGGGNMGGWFFLSILNKKN